MTYQQTVSGVLAVSVIKRFSGMVCLVHVDCFAGLKYCLSVVTVHFTKRLTNGFQWNLQSVLQAKFTPFSLLLSFANM